MKIKSSEPKALSENVLNANVIVAALGYFVDIYDLLLFGIVRVASLKDIGVPDSELLEKGVLLINAQMFGMLLGGLLWGVIGDKKGRIAVLFGSILMYSVANILNAFVTDVETYAVLRFVAGIGLAGELGAAITLVSETLTKEKRGYGTTIVASVGILGAVVAGLIGDFFSWQMAYIIGGVMGLALLALRVSMSESGLFHDSKNTKSKKGDIKMLFYPPARFIKYAQCILIGLPVWYAVGILMTFSPELAKDLGVTAPIAAGSTIMWGYLGLAIGDLTSGLLSQYFRTRRFVVLGFLLLTAALSIAYYFAVGVSATEFYILCGLIGFAVGYWAVFVTVAAEQFGTNLRSTVTTSVPNFVRGGVVPITLAFQGLAPFTGLRMSALIVGGVVIFIALAALHFMPETYNKDLDYIEE
jgi:MFS transporter, putative metabolite:H+ symporter